MHFNLKWQPCDNLCDKLESPTFAKPDLCKWQKFWNFKMACPLNKIDSHASLSIGAPFPTGSSGSLVVVVVVVVVVVAW